MKIFKNLMLAFTLIFVASSQVFAKASLEDEAKYLPCAEFSGAEKNECTAVLFLSFINKYMKKQLLRKYASGKSDAYNNWDDYKNLNVSRLHRDIDANMSFVALSNLVENTIGYGALMVAVDGKSQVTEEDIDSHKSRMNDFIETVTISLMGLHNELFKKTNGQEYVFENRLYSKQDFDKAHSYVKNLKYRNRDVYSILSFTNNEYKYSMQSYKDVDIKSNLENFSKDYAKNKSVYALSFFYASIYESMLKNVKNVESDNSIYYIFADKKLDQVDFIKKDINRLTAAK